MSRTTPGRAASVLRWTALVAEALVVIVAVVWIVSGQLWALLAWETISLAYLVGGGVAVWRGSNERSGSAEGARAVARWAWVLPLLASVVGATSAVTALTARRSSSSSGDQLVLAVAASLAVVVSWTVLHVGFAEIYQALDESDPDVDGIEFPGRDTGTSLDYLYFSFTVGTSFATSDAQVTTLPIRRIVLVHSVVGFFYNALVVATAIQVLQQLVSD